MGSLLETLSQLRRLEKQFPLSKIAEMVIFHDGKPLSLKQYLPFISIYNDTQTKSVLIKAGRQVAKSVTLRNKLILYSIFNDHFKSLYVVPLQEQASRFGNFYLNPAIQYSPIIKREMQDSTCVNNVFAKSFSNGSVVQLAYSLYDAERIRGIPSDLLLYDETQNILVENIPVINECLSASPFKYRMYAGTPKTLDNTMEYLWLQSSQQEWIMPCSGCGKYNVPIAPYVYKMIQPKGLSCAKCGKLINVREGEWYSFAPENTALVGYHVPQLIIPRNVESPSAWQEILQKREGKLRYPPAKFANEVLGLSYDIGGRIVTLDELRAVCKLPSMVILASQRDSLGCSVVCAGLDWGISAETSYTVLVIGGIGPDGIVKVFFVKKYLGTDILQQIEDVISWCRAYGVSFIGCDFGVGYTNNLILKSKLGVDKILEYQYAHSSHLLHWNEKVQRYILDRTGSLNLLFVDLKNGRIQTPPYEEMQDYFEGILSLYEDITESTSRTVKVFRTTPGIPADFAHALNFLTITLRKAIGDPVVSLVTDSTSSDIF